MQPNVYFPSSWWDLPLLIIFLILSPIGIRNILQSAKSKKKIPAKIIFVGLLILVGIWFCFAKLGYWFLIGVGALVLIFWIKPWNWKIWNKIQTFTTTTGTTGTKPVSHPMSIQKLIWTILLLIASIWFGFYVYINIVSTYRDFQTKPVDQNAMLPGQSPVYLQHGEHIVLTKGEENTYIVAQGQKTFFYPTNFGDSIHYRLRCKQHPTEWADMKMYRNTDGSIPDENFVIIHNEGLGCHVGEYTIMLLDYTKEITYSDHPIN